MVFKKKAGFTLIELIVVIAILAILAGVGTAAYTGYMEKANKAADDTLIAAINRAAATAVLEVNGKDMMELADGKLISNATKGQKNITVNDRNKNNAELGVSFAKYFEGNGEAALKWYGCILFEDGAFRGVESRLAGVLADPTNGAAGTAFKNSSYNADSLGVDGVTTMVDDLAGALAEYEAFNLIAGTDAFKKTLAGMGITSDADEQTMANASVFYLASCLEKLDQAELYQNLADNTLSTYLTGKQLPWDDDTTVTLADKDVTFIETALKYASATAYVHSLDNNNPALRDTMFQTPANKNEALANITNVTTGANANDYDYYLYETGNGEADFNAFYQIMMVVNSNQGSFKDVEGGSLFSNAETQAAINELLNRNP